jgi:DNA-directed RNA polymerase specialized sigma subunit
MKNLNLIRSIAWSFHKTTGICFDDLMGEASLAYCEGLLKYDAKKGMITTFMFFYIRRHLINHIHKEYIKQPKLLSFEEIRVTETIDPQYLIDSLSPDARKIADVVLSSPKIFCTISPEKAKKRIKTILQKKGMPLRRIWIGMRDLKTELS